MVDFESLLKEYKSKIEDEFYNACVSREPGRGWDNGFSDGYYEGLKHALCIFMNKEYKR